MNEAPKKDVLLRSVQLRQQRERQRQGEPAVARRLAQIGVLGWTIVIPTLTGVFAGRWLDRTFHSGLFYTAPLLMIGAALGFWLAWRWMQTA